jgi:hypothetical protein
MGDGEVPLIIMCDADEAEQLAGVLRDIGLDAHASERRNLDGAMASDWIIAAAVATQAISHVIRSLQPFFDRRKIREIKFGDTIIKDVQAEDAAQLITLIQNLAEKGD